MRVRSWVAACTTSIKPNGSSNSFDITASATSSSNYIDTNHSSLQRDLSIQTLPSVPSLQKLSPENINFSLSHLRITSIEPKPSFPINCIAIHNDLLYAACNHIINVYDRRTSTHVDTFNAHDSSSGSVKSVTFSDGKIFTSHQDCKIRVWILTTTKQHKFLTVLPTVKDRLRRFILPKNYVNVRRHKKRLWIEHDDAVSGLAVNNGLMYSVSWDKSLKIWRASDLCCLESVIAHQDAVNAIVVSVDGTIYTGSADRMIRVWAKPLGEKKHVLVSTLEKHKSAVNALALNDDASILFSGACDRSILLWRREDSANHMVLTGALRGHSKAILCLINVSDSLFSGSADCTVRMWRRGHDGRYSCLAVLDGHVKPVKSLAVAIQDGSNAAVSVYSGSLDGVIKIWEVTISRPLIN
ncbi:WD40 domain-containing protein [Cephalotus follicularis]|uniref:WD40 domain-containing protein n=1 Tax=Cephalotus follicularis TaxID=3775 RepID=A0A1Q3CS76_CEPFO|nr:WD40 domain-containing protein [Cephalotus follicularis]